MSDIDDTKEYETSVNYDDSETFRIFRSLAKLLEMSSDEMYEVFGTWVVKYGLETGWDKLLSCMAYTLHVSVICLFMKLYSKLNQIYFRNSWII